MAKRSRQTSQTEDLMLLTEKEASKETGFAIRSFQNWRYRGGGPAFVRFSSRNIRYRRSDLLKWIESRVATSTSEYGDED